MVLAPKHCNNIFKDLRDKLTCLGLKNKMFTLAHKIYLNEYMMKLQFQQVNTNSYNLILILILIFNINIHINVNAHLIQ